MAESLTTICIRTLHACLVWLRYGMKPDTEEPGTRYTAFRCPEDLLEVAKIKARKDRRSLSNYLITLIEKDVKDEMPSHAEKGK